MPNIASVLKEEISRIARKEVKAEVDAIRKVVSAHRSEIAELKRRNRELEQAVKRLQKNPVLGKPDAAEAPPTEQVRYSAKGLSTHRRKLGLSAADYGKLAGASGQSIYKWEEGARPRAKQLHGLMAIRRLGKREALARLEAMR